MSSRTSVYRVLLSLFVVALSICAVLPLRDRPFRDHIVNCVTDDKAEFAAIVERADERLKVGKSKSFYLAIRDVANGENVDLSRFFRKKNLMDVRDLREKNRLLLDSILTDSKGKIKQGLDLKGGVSFVLKMDDSRAKDLGTKQRMGEQLNKAIDIIRQRIDGLGVAEPIVRIFGDNCIEVQLPGVSTKDNPEIVDAIKKPAKLEFRLLHDSLAPKSQSERAPVGYETMAMERRDGSTAVNYVFVKKIPEMTGSMVKRANVVVGQYGGYEISLVMTDAGAKRFEKITAENVGKNLAIVLDGKLYSAPVIRTAISNGNASISGDFSQRDAFELSNVLNNPLEVELKFVELNEVGPSLADDARVSSINSSIVGSLIVCAFMVAYYHIAGCVSLLAIVANIAIVLGAMVSIGATLTLPGIAALVLTVGMAVDANILIFERMREELLAGKGLTIALQSGHQKAFSSIFDANLTTLLTAVILVYFGAGPVKGFGVVLSIGILATMFCALVLSRGILEILVEKNIAGKLIPNFGIKSPSINFMKYAKAMAIAYGVLLVLCLGTVALRHSKVYGIDFTGGDEIMLKFEQKISISEINRVAAENEIGEVVAVYQRSTVDGSEILRIQTEEGMGGQIFDCLHKSFGDANLSLLRKTEIGSSVGSGIKLNAIISVALSVVGIVLYVAFRFERGYGVGAVISTLLDVILTVAAYLALGRQISAPMIASILMVIGYSINDTIIVFDRIREELKLNDSLSLGDVINLSINKTLSRTVLTSSTTFLAAIALYLLGSGVIADFALVFIIGIAVGTFSSIFIASPVFFAWHSGDRKTVAGVR